MGRFTSFLSNLIFAKAAPSGGGGMPPVDPSAMGTGLQVDWLAQRGPGPLKRLVTPDELVKQYWGWVYACASIGAATLAALPLRLYAARGTGQAKARRKSRPVRGLEDKRLRRNVAYKSEVSNAEELEEITEHPLLDLLKNVNFANNQYDLKEQTSLYLDLTGNGLWYLKMNALNQPEEIWVLQPQRVSLKRDPAKGIVGYLYGQVGQREQIALDPEEVIHFRYPNPLDPWWGMGPVQAGLMAVSRQESMDVYENATLKNMGRPDVAVVYKGGQLEENERRDLEIAWNNAYRGADKAGKIRVMDEQFEIKELGWSPREMAYVQGRNWTLKEIAAMFPVPVALLDTEQISRAPRSGMDGTAMFMGQYNTLPRTRRIEEKLNERLTPLYDERLFLAFDNPVPDDVAMELQSDTALLGSYVITINEARGHRGLEPVEWGDKPWAPPGLAELGTPAPAAPGFGGGFGAGKPPSPPLGAAKKPKPEDSAEEADDESRGASAEDGPSGGGEPFGKGWITVNGAHIMVGEGESAAEAVRERFGGGKDGDKKPSSSMREATAGLSKVRDMLIGKLGDKLSKREMNEARFQISVMRDELRNSSDPDAESRIAFLDRAEDALREGNVSGAANRISRVVGPK